MIIDDLSFNPCFNGSYSYTSFSTSVLTSISNVSILVLMEVTLIHYYDFNESSEYLSFNPCFNGSYSYTKNDRTLFVANDVAYITTILMNRVNT